MQVELDLVNQHDTLYLTKTLVWLGELESPSEIGKQYQINSLPAGELINMDVITAGFCHIQTGMLSRAIETNAVEFRHFAYQSAYSMELRISVTRPLIAMNSGFLSVSPIPPIAKVLNGTKVIGERLSTHVGFGH